MAKKNLAGQLNMFDVFRELENNMETAGEVEMVSHMPETEPAVQHDHGVKPQKKSEPDCIQEEDDMSLKTISGTAIDENKTVENEVVENKTAENETAENEVVENKTAENEIAEHRIEDIDIKEHEIHTNATEKISDVAMHREKHDADGNVIAEISYINYNKVLIRRKGHDDILKCFDNSHDAVDYYVENMNLNNLV